MLFEKLEMRFLSILLFPFILYGAASRPNIIFILADDLGIGDVKCYGKERSATQTPNLDALAANGLRFTDAYVNASVCVPTRVAIMTGRYPWRFGDAAPGGPWGFLGTRFDTDTLTLGKILNSANYHTGYIGKWHLGTKMHTMDGKVQGADNVDFKKPLLIGPVEHGFEYSYILPGSLDMYPYAFVQNNHWQGQVTAQKGWSAFNRVGPAEVNFQDHEVLETFYREAENFIGRQCSSQPFFLYLALTAPHTPISPGKNWEGKSKLGLYGDFVMEVDHGVERVMNALKMHSLDEDTLIIFSSDHGAGAYAGNIRKATPNQIKLLEKQGHYASGPHRGYKFSVYEGGLRVPLIAHWPKGIQPGTTSSALVGLCDLAATFAELSGAKYTEQQLPDSISFAQVLKNPTSKSLRKTMIMQSIGSYGIRQDQWKLCLGPGSGSYLDYGNTPKEDIAWREALMTFGRNPTRQDLLKPPFVQLYNMENDPHEDHNLASKHPEVVEQLIASLQKQMVNGRSTNGPKLNNDRSTPLHFRLPKFVTETLR
jgi:arylsulfatase A